MSANVLSPQDLVRRAVTEVVSLQDPDLLIVLEIVADLKRAKVERRTQAAEMVALARKRAAELKGLPQAELIKRLTATLDSIRAEAIAKGTAIEGEWEGD